MADDWSTGEEIKCLYCTTTASAAAGTTTTTTTATTTTATTTTTTIPTREVAANRSLGTGAE